MKKNGLNVDMIKIIAPLLNFIKERSKALKIGNDFIIREARSTEKDFVRGVYKNNYSLGKFEADYPTKFCVIESHLQLNKSEKYHPMDTFRGSEGYWLRMMEENQKILLKCRRNIEKKLVFLRLQKQGPIGSKVFAIKERTSMVAMTVNYYVPWIYPNYPKLYKFLDTDIDKYVEDYQLFGKKISFEEPMFRYFFKSYHEPLVEDRLVDLVISLESLYLAGEPEKTLLR